MPQHGIAGYTSPPDRKGASKMKLIAATLAAYFAALGPSFGADWRLSGTQGLNYFVLIDKAQSRNTGAYRRAIADICGNKPICFVSFWVEGTEPPKTLPMTDRHADTMAANWGYNRNTGFQKLLWNCQMFPGSPKEECMAR